MKKILGIAAACVLVLLLMFGAFLQGHKMGKEENQAYAISDLNKQEEAGKAGQQQTAPSVQEDVQEDGSVLEKTASAKDTVSVSYKTSSSWEGEGGFYANIEATLKNYTDKEVNDWEVELAVPAGAKLDQFWNGTCKIKDTTLHVTPMDYNAAIPAKETVSFGFIIITPSVYKPEKSSVRNVSDAKKESTKSVKTAVRGAVKKHGKLQVKGKYLVDKKGRKVRLKGVSTHGIAWFPEYVNQKAFRTLRDRMGVNLIRLALYSDPSAGYSRTQYKNIDKGVKYAAQLGMYVIIDWHILSDGNPKTNQKEALHFFKRMSKKYKNYKNVMYEICNEPNGNVTWQGDVKPYAKKVIKAIRKQDKKAVVIVGSPTWSQDVDVVAKSPLKGKNIMYSLHFYAATHKQDLRGKAQSAINAGLPLFVTEFSICEASGNGSLDKAEGKRWMKFLKKNNISMAIWSLCNKDEAASLLKPSCKKKSGWKNSDWSAVGKWYKKVS